MPFTKETAKIEGAKGNLAKEKIKGDRFKWIVNRGFEKATDVINDMLDGQPVTKEQQEAVRLLEKFVKYEKAQKTDHTTDGEKIEGALIQFVNADDKHTS